MGMKFFIFQTQLQGVVKYFGRLVLKESYDQEMLIKRMLEMGTSMTKTDIKAVLNLLATAVANVCAEGNKIILDDFIQITPVLGGSFTGKNDDYNSSKNEVYLTAQVCKTLNDRITNAVSVEKIAVDEQRPLVLEVTDHASKTGNLVMGHIIGIFGKRLKVDLAVDGEYLRLVNADDTKVYVDIKDFYNKTAQELTFLLPTVNFTKGYFEIVTSMNTRTLRKGLSPVYTLEAAV